MTNRSQPAHPASPPPATWDDIVSSLVWPLILRAPRLALRPSRVLVALFTLVVVSLTDRVPTLWNPDHPGVIGTLVASASRVAESWSAPGFAGLFPSLTHFTLITPWELIRGSPVATLLVLLVGVPAWALGTLAVCRSAVVELAGAAPLPWPRTVAFGRERVLSGMGVLFTPWALYWTLAVTIAGLGWLMLRVPWLQVVGGALFFVVVALAALTLLVLLCALAGSLLFIPALATEATDALDAMQRVGAYLIARPVRFAAYTFVAVLLGVLAIGVVSVLAGGVQWLAAGLSTSWLPQHLSAAITGMDEGASSSARTAARLTAFWLQLPAFFVLGYALSYICCAGTAVYMVLRRVCDGQDTSELWEPGSTPVATARTDLEPARSTSEGEA
ncbi:MAG: hypothetical protein KF864_07835 [Phycisphaeraceae bacterium]|nr:hypothetical protein [Phycisphaeraceae bacterium]